MSKKIVVVTSVIIYLLSAYFSHSFFNDGEKDGFKSPIVLYKPPKGSQVASSLENEPKTEECPLTGELLTKTQRDLWEARRPLGIMIENHQEARPQSGLTSADIIYEAVAEGGITRFLAIFYCKDASYVGPVRSARVYFIDLLSEYGDYPLYAHVGGANTEGPANALGKIVKLKWNLYNDLNQFAVPFPYYWRDYERLPGRVTEHTVYSTTQKLWQFAKEKRNLSAVDEAGERWDENFTQWEFKKDQPLKEPAVTKIAFDFWSDKADYAVVWEYNPINNSFKRFNGGEPHQDRNSETQIEARNVVVLMVQESSANDGYPGGHLLYDLTGEGEAIIFQDGAAVEAKWEKEDAAQQMRFYDRSGQEVAFNRGQMFIEIVPEGNTINY